MAATAPSLTLGQKLSKEWGGAYLEWGICNFLPTWDLTTDFIMKTGDTVRPVALRLWAACRSSVGGAFLARRTTRRPASALRARNFVKVETCGLCLLQIRASIPMFC